MDEAEQAAGEAGWLDSLLQIQVGGVELWPLLLAVGILAGAYWLRTRLAALLRRWMELGAARTETTIDDDIGEALEQPLGLLAFAIAAFASAQILGLTGVAGRISESLVVTLFATAFFWALLRMTPVFGQVLRGWDQVLTDELACWTERILRVAIWLVAGATILEIWGVRVAPIIAGFGLIGVAVALGAQDLFKNLISGALVLTEKRFRVGDWIKVDGKVEGTVEAINFRSTKVRRFDKAPVYLPNKDLADGAVTNFGEMTHRRIFWRVGLEYRSSADQMQSIREKVETFIREDGRFLVPPHGTLLVRIDQFADSSIDLLIYCFTRTRDWAEWLQIKEELLLFIKRTVEEAGTGIAFPSRTVYVDGGDAALLPAPQKAPADTAEKPPAKTAAKSTGGATRTRRAPAKAGAKPKAETKPKAAPRSRAKAKGPEDGPTDGLAAAPEDEGAGPTGRGA